jgi:general stress protein 26
MKTQLSKHDALTEAVRVVNSTLLGVMVTIDEQGQPQPRWMGAASTDRLRYVYCLTAKNTRKLAHLAVHPQTTWMFTSESNDGVVTLSGKAQAIASPLATQEVWDRLLEIGEPFLVSTMGQNSTTELVAVQTIVNRVEFLCPKLGVYDPILIELD